MDLTVSLRALVRTIERGSITAAARDLAVSQPAVTKHIKNLERHVGAQLLERSARLVRPTALGQTLYEAGRLALGTIDSALENVRRDMGAVEGLLRIHAPACIGARHLHTIIVAFQENFPMVDVDLVLEMRSVDLVYENFDLAISYGKPDAQDLIIRRLGHVRRILVATPGFLEREGPVETVEDLGRIGMVTTARAATRDKLTLFKDGKALDVPVRAVLRTNDAQVLTAALLGGRLAGPVQQLLVSDDLATGRLVRVLPDHEARASEAFLVYPSVRFMRPAVRAFTDFVVPALRAVDGIDQPDGSTQADADPLEIVRQRGRRGGGDNGVAFAARGLVPGRPPHRHSSRSALQRARAETER